MKRLIGSPLGRAYLGFVLVLVGLVQVAAGELLVGVVMTVVGVFLLVRGVVDWRRARRATPPEQV